MEKILFINSCYNEEKSRTIYLANKLFEKFDIDSKFDFEEIKLKDLHLLPLSEEKLKVRFDLANKKLFDMEMLTYSKKILSADVVVIAAPFYDFSYPSILKLFIENVSMPNLMYTYTKDGFEGFARGRKFIYITTRGSELPDSEDFGYLNLDRMFKLFGFKESQLISFGGTDFYEDPKNKIDELVKTIKNPF
ncbi:MAG: NAD(P)H-dependent oxidoreductase [Acholeplasmatales bacterium]|nr:NAD(P)H-dependent oxidoreductase [Acholeplasmatales bacterium]